MAAVNIDVHVVLGELPMLLDEQGVVEERLDGDRVADMRHALDVVRRHRNDVVRIIERCPHLGEGSGQTAVTVGCRAEVAVEVAEADAAATARDATSARADAHEAGAVRLDVEFRLVPTPLVANVRAERVRLRPGDGHLVLGAPVAAVPEGTDDGLTDTEHREAQHDRSEQRCLPAEHFLQEVLVETLLDEVPDVGNVAHRVDDAATLEDLLDDVLDLLGRLGIDLEEDCEEGLDQDVHGVQRDRQVGHVGVDRGLAVVVQVDSELRFVAGVEDQMITHVGELSEVEFELAPRQHLEVGSLDLQRVVPSVDDLDDSLVLLDAEAPVDGVLPVGRDLVVVLAGVLLVLALRLLRLCEDIRGHAVDELLLQFVHHPDQVGPERREPRQLGHREGDVLFVWRQRCRLELPAVRGVRVVDGHQDEVVLAGLVIQRQRDLHRRRQLAARCDAGDVPLFGRCLVVLERRCDRVLGRLSLEHSGDGGATGRDGRAGVVLSDDLGLVGRDRLRGRLVVREDA